jgi:hypothetical protein
MMPPIMGLLESLELVAPYLAYFFFLLGLLITLS